MRRIDGKADVADRAVRGIAGELDHLLAGQRGLADDRLVVALLASSRSARALFLVRVDEQRVGVALLRLEHGAGEVDLARVGRDVGGDLDASASSALMIVSRPPLPKSLLTQISATVFAFTAVLDVLRDLRHRRRLRERRAEDVRVALLVRRPLRRR